MARQIIIIDDNVSDSNEMKRLLSGFGADVFQALRIGSAKEYLTKFKTGDIVICDFKLADGNVVELIDWLDHKNIRCRVFVISTTILTQKRRVHKGLQRSPCRCTNQS